MKLFLIALLLVSAVVSTSAIATDVAAPSITLEDVDGNSITLPSHKDGVDIYLYWATWCPYCSALMPHFQSIVAEYGDKVRVYAIHVKDEEDPWPYMEEKGYDFTLLIEADSAMEPYGVKGIPAVFLVDKKGNIRFNLYKMMFNDSDEFKSLAHRDKASRRAPNWAAEIRKTLDTILAE